MRSDLIHSSKRPTHSLSHVEKFHNVIDLQSPQVAAMGRRRKGHNWKARVQPSEQVQSAHTTDKVVIENTSEDSDGLYQKSQGTNALVISDKTVTKKRPPGPATSKQKKLSKKQRKRLEKIVEKKHKKARRADLLEALQGCAVTDREMALMNSTTCLGQKRKRSSTGDSHKVAKTGSNVSSIRRSREQRQEPVETDSAVEAEESDSDESSVCSSEPEDSSPVAAKDAQKLSGEDAEEKCGNCAESIQGGPAPSTSCVDKETPTVGAPREPAVFVEIKRDPEIQAARLQLPILAEEQSVMEAIKGKDIVIICGETGSGKTTQVPQFLFEAGFSKQGLIGVTEPRRVAAVSMSKRVAMEMSMSCDTVSYQIRYEGNVSEKTLVKFMTDGVLLKEIESDFLLSKYSAIVLDEAHECSVYTDILIGLLSRIVPLRKKQGKNLKLIIMSASLCVADFTSNAYLFPTPPPAVSVESRQYPVSVHFNKHTPEDYLQEAYRKVCKIHRTLPPGGILVFVTGQGEVHSLCKKLRRTFPVTKKLGHEEDLFPRFQ